MEERRKAFGYLARRGHGTPGGGEEARGGGARVGATQSGRRMGWGRVGGGGSEPAIFRFHDEFSRLACCETEGGGGASGREKKGTGIIIANYERVFVLT